MKTLLLAVLLVVLSLGTTLAQSVFEDAKTLSRYFVKDVDPAIKPKLNPESVLSETEQILKILKKETDSLSTIANDRLKQFQADKKKQNEAIREQQRVIALEKKMDSITHILSDISGAKNDSIIAIIKKYGLANAEGTGADGNKIKSNPFLNEFDFGGFVRARNLQKAIKSVASSVGGLDVTSIANAVSDIMIEHAKQELTVAFFDRFKKFAEENPEFGILFPKTTDNLKNLLSYKYPEMLPALRSGFLEDTRQLAFRLDDVLNLPRYQEIFKDLPQVAVAIRSLRLVHELETGASNPADVIKQFSSFKEWQSTSTNISPSFKTVGSIVKISALFSESVRSSKDDEVWVSGKQLKKLFYGEDEILVKVYLGLLYQKAQLEKVEYITSSGAVIPFTKMLTDHKDDIFTYRNKLKEFVDLTGRVNDTYKEIKTKKAQGLSNDDYYSYINTSLDVVEYGFSLAELFGEDVQTAEQYLAILRQSNDLFRNIYTKEYNQAISNTLEIISKIRELAKDRKGPAITPINAEAIANGKSNSVKQGALEVMKTDEGFVLKKDGTILRSFKALDVTLAEKDATYYVASKDEDKDPLTKLLTFVDKVKPYALFIANMIEAESEEDIKNAIENAILPVGSSSIKKFSISNISIQSYLGPRLSVKEWSTGKTTWNNTLGVTAPIGVAFSWGLGRGRDGIAPGSFSLFLVAFDLGAIVDYKLTTDEDGEVSEDYKVEFAQILAPGGYAVYGAHGKIPLSFGVGTQYGPGLLNGSNGIEAVNPDWSIRIFLAVDIPFFTLSNKPRPDVYEKK